MIRAEKLSKFYGGKRALGPVSFEIAEGETVGFLGLNGAGKTTALRILACDLRPSGGSVAVGDVDALADPHKVRQRIGFLPESPPVYQDMSVTDYLHFAGQLRGMSKGDVRKRMPKVLEVTHLTDVDDEIIGHLSHGFRQRVGVAQAIIHSPTLLILDEPTRGLDPVQIVEMRNLIHELKEDHTVLISSHILTEISQTCDRLLVLGQGRILASGSEQELTVDLADVKSVVVMVRPLASSDDDAKSPQGEGGDGGDDGDDGGEPTNASNRESASDADDPVAKLLKGIEGVSEVAGGDASNDRARSYRLTCNGDVRADIGRAIVNAGHDLLKLDEAHSELEQTFMQLVQGGRDANN